MNVLVSIMVALSVVLVAALAVGKFYNFFAKYRWALLLTAFIYGVIIYSIGYWGIDYQFTVSNVFAVALQGLFSAGRFFIFDSDLSLLINFPLVKTASYLIAFSFGGLFAMFSLATAVLSTFGGSMVMYLRCAMSSTKNVYILVGANKDTVNLAIDIKKKNKRATVIISDDLKSVVAFKEVQKSCSKNKIILLNIQISDEKACEKLFVSKLYSMLIKKSKGQLKVLVMTGDKLQNLNIATNVLQKTAINKKATLYCFAVAMLNTAALDNLKINENWQVRLFNYEQIVAEQFTADNHMVDVLPIDAEHVNVFRGGRILLVCEGELAMALTLSIVQDSQFECNYPSLTLWGEDAEEVIAQLSEANTELYKCVTINSFNQAAYDVQFFNTAKNGDYDFIILGLNDSAKNLRTAELLAQNSIGAKVFALAKEHNYYELKRKGNYGNIELFGDEIRIMTAETIIDGSLDSAAIAVNKFYNGGKDDYYTKRTIEQQSNKYFGLNIPTKLTLLGLEMCAINAVGVMTTADFKLYVGDRIEDLARQEHARWNGFHFANGYKTWDLNDIPDGYAKTKCEEKKLHACLVTYDELDAVSDRFAEKVKDVAYGYKGYDIMLVERIPDILSYCKLGVKIKGEKQ